MIANTALVGLITGHACPLKCDFCCHDRETLGPGRMSRQLMVDTIMAFASEPSVGEFAFSGGDPFLYYKDIVAALREIRERGVVQPFHIVTSGYWAKDGKTRPILEELLSLGVTRICVSYDHEHAKWVRPEQVREIAAITGDIGMKMDIVGTFWNSTEKVQDIIPSIDEHVRMMSYIVYPAGRAGRSGRRPNRIQSDAQINSCGQPTKYTIAVFGDGEAFPCCSGDFNRSAKLSSGNVGRDTGAEILHNAFGNFHVRVAKEIGWSTLYAVVDAHFPELAPRLPKFADVDSPCEICRTLNLTLKEELAPVYAMIETEYVRSRAELDWDRRVPAEAAAGEARLDGTAVTRDDLHARFTADPALRRRYLSDQVRIEA